MDSQKLQFGFHAVSIYKSIEEQFKLALPFFVDGLRDQYKCVYIIDPKFKNNLLSEFKKLGVDVQKYLESKQLEILDSDDIYLKNDTIDTVRMIDLVSKIDISAKNDGYVGVLAVGEPPLVSMEYESALDKFLEESKMSIICNYDESKQELDLLAEIIKVHQNVAIYGKLYENKYFYTYPKYIDDVSTKFSSNSYQIIKEMIMEG